MKFLRFWFDPVSPYSYLAFERLPLVLEGISHAVDYQPLLFAGLLKHWGQKGPAEIEPKRAWTFRQVHWLARQHGIELATPAEHPFNPLALLRLLVAAAPAGAGPSRHACELVLHHVWRGGADAIDADRVAILTAALAPRRDPNGDEVKQALRAATEAAAGAGIFGVPTVEVDGLYFWGLDALGILAQYLRGDAGFDRCAGRTPASRGPACVARSSASAAVRCARRTPFASASGRFHNGESRQRVCAEFVSAASVSRKPLLVWRQTVVRAGREDAGRTNKQETTGWRRLRQRTGR